ncbi:hypothetical protein [Kineosporia sp. NBRC 101731]|uniref:hypothetical protein n=1 Tax=Kineosporia sp. NBRC 101731 TaxID=3032199 RepID=UPI002556C2EF|nr:hypothetical protein [Kineosporia sp. NBRC 101731]
MLAGPLLYIQYERGGLDGYTAVLNWCIVALLCMIGASLIMDLISRYEQEWDDKDAADAREAAQNAAETEAKRAAEEAERRAQAG